MLLASVSTMRTAKAFRRNLAIAAFQHVAALEMCSGGPCLDEFAGLLHAPQDDAAHESRTRGNSNAGVCLALPKGRSMLCQELRHRQARRCPAVHCEALQGHCHWRPPCGSF
ncbi:hypothetical protein EJ03DRAFT_5627 [Teratosphaeria nubilosa]|uniref:Uncharacterized protein n=1 Tax=Teratosphaeria nubilosa TaxID=161662 RepID=A0A6G1LQE3_9PEZI|nr:hypothetical protein EJ03DRAFT_5627 [Teratosphaeria nubilosa]